MNPLPFRLKIALLSVGISGLVLLAFGAAAWALVSHQKWESLDTEIRSLGARHPGWIATRGNYQRLDEALAFIFGEAHQDEIILLVKDASGGVLHTSPGWPADLPPAQIDDVLADDPKALAAVSTGPNVPGSGLGRGRGGMGRGLGPGGGGGVVAFTKIPKFQTVTTTRGKWRLGLLGTADTTLVIGLNYNRAQAELNRLRNAFLIALLLALILIGVAGWLVASRALHPMSAIAATAERVTGSGLAARIPASNEDPEIARVIQVLNRMMDRLEASFRQATRFSADASHELKTPLAIMQGELENALHAAVPGSPEQQLFNNLLEETQRLTTITRSLLLLAQADAGQLRIAREPLDLSAELEALIEDARVLAPDLRLNFETHLPPGLRIQADRALLHTALFNLLGNAIKYNVPDGRIELRLESERDQIFFTIGNTGAGIPTGDQVKVFERFYRGGPPTLPRSDGSGLGLSLAREIVRAHGGDLVLAESRPGWTAFRVTLDGKSGTREVKPG